MTRLRLSTTARHSAAQTLPTAMVALPPARTLQQFLPRSILAFTMTARVRPAKANTRKPYMAPMQAEASRDRSAQALELLLAKLRAPED